MLYLYPMGGGEGVMAVPPPPRSATDPVLVKCLTCSASVLFNVLFQCVFLVVCIFEVSRVRCLSKFLCFPMM